MSRMIGRVVFEGHEDVCINQAQHRVGGDREYQIQDKEKRELIDKIRAEEKERNKNESKS